MTGTQHYGKLQPFPKSSKMCTVRFNLEETKCQHFRSILKTSTWQLFTNKGFKSRKGTQEMQSDNTLCHTHKPSRDQPHKQLITF